MLRAGKADRSDVIDAAVVLLAGDDGMVLTSDPEDLADLAAVADTHVELLGL